MMKVGNLSFGFDLFSSFPFFPISNLIDHLVCLFACITLLFSKR